MATDTGIGAKHKGLSRFSKQTKAARRVAGAAHRDPPGILIYPSGRGEANVAGSELIYGLAATSDPPLNVEQFAVLFGGDEETKQVAVWAVDPKTDGATVIRRDKGSATMTIYLHDLFKDMPKLRPAAKKLCTLTTETDPVEGTAAIILLSVGLESQKTKRKGETGSEPMTP